MLGRLLAVLKVVEVVVPMVHAQMVWTMNLPQMEQAGGSPQLEKIRLLGAWKNMQMRAGEKSHYASQKRAGLMLLGWRWVSREKAAVLSWFVRTTNVHGKGPCT